MGDSLVEVVLYIRQADLAWFNQTTTDTNIDEEDDSKTDADKVDHGTDLLQVLSQSVIPREFEKTVEKTFYKRNPHLKPPPKLGQGGIPIWTGPDKPKQPKYNQNKRGKKRRAKPIAFTEPANEEGEDEDAPRKIERNVYYAFGQTLQLAYRLEDITERKGRSATLVFRENNQTERKEEEGIMTELARLPKRIVAWIYPYDPKKPNELDPSDGGFPNPERIPIAQLFRSAGGGENDGDS